MGESVARRPEVHDLDAEVLRRAQAGERRAQGRIVERHQRAVYALVTRMLAPETAGIDDVAQDAFIKALRGLPGFDPAGPATLSTWILTITARTCIDALRRRRRREPREDAVGEEPRAPDLEAGVAGEQLGARVAAAVAELPAEQRAVVVLRAYHDLDYPEIASALGIEAGTVKSRLSRARAALKRALDWSET
jgi:RNA polymerase sigma-70 factor, ECF subfamily